VSRVSTVLLGGLRVIVLSGHARVLPWGYAGACLSRGIAARLSFGAPDEADLVGLVVALGPDLTGRAHFAYRRRTDRRWWRRQYRGRRLPPDWDYVSLCGRQGLVLAPHEAVDCRSCRRNVVGRRRRLDR